MRKNRKVIQVSLKDSVLEEIDAEAERLGLSRSSYLSLAGILVRRWFSKSHISVEES